MDSLGEHALTREELLAEIGRLRAEVAAVRLGEAGATPGPPPETMSFRAILDALYTFAGVLALDGTILEVNRPPLDVAGLGSGDVVGRKLWDCYWFAHSAEARERTRAAVSRAAAGERPRFDEDVQVRDGRLITVDLMVAPIVGAGGRVERLVASAVDVTDRARADRELRQRERELRAVTANTPDLLLRFDRALRHVFANDAVRATGLAPADVLGKTLGELGMPDPLRDWCESHLRRVFTTGAAQSVEFDVDTPAGGRRHYAARLVPEVVGDGDGSAAAVAHVLAVARDVTDERQVREELRRARDEAEAASRAKDHFLAVLSHELRTPLAPVLIAAEMLARDPAVPAAARAQLVMIRRNVELEARLIDDLLDLTRIARGKLQLHGAPVDAHELLADVVDMCRDDATRPKDVRVASDLAAADRCVLADAARLSQVFWNLLKNAVKFTPAGGAVSVRTLNPSAGWLAVEVRDTGVGIAPDVLPTIFEPFEQGGAAVTSRFGGLGLGLAIAKALVDLHLGRIEAASPGPGAGATFTVYLPTVPATAAAPGSDATATATATATQSLRILLVDDHEPTARTLAAALRGLGHVVRTAGSVAEAVAVAAGHALDLVVSDLGLPDGSGHDLMLALRAAHHLPGIALSGYGMPEDVARSLASGFARHLTKPITLEALEEAIDEVMGAPP